MGRGGAKRSAPLAVFQECRIGDWLTARKTDAPAAAAGYEVLYQGFNGSHTAPEARSAQSRTIGLRHHLQPRLEHSRYAVQVF